MFSIHLHPISTKNEGCRDVDDDDNDDSPRARASSKMQMKPSAESVLLIICRSLYYMEVCTEQNHEIHLCVKCKYQF